MNTRQSNGLLGFLNFFSLKVKGFNFLVNSYWPEVEQRIEDYLPIIFAPGNPESFHKVYIIYQILL